MRLVCTSFLALSAVTSTAAFSSSSNAARIHVAPRSTTMALGSTVLPPPRTIPVEIEKDITEVIDSVVQEVPRAGEVAKMLPKTTFEIDTKTSLFYFAVDFVAVAATMGFLNGVVNSEIYHSAPVLLQGMMVAPLQVLTGFAMWCMWCIGHDAGHNVVSKEKKINRFVGEMAHSMICLTPFIPWAKSHKKHHLGHNHLTKDYSHQWFIREESDDLHPLIKLSYKTRNLQLPILYFVYLFLGVPDGGHVIFYGKMWEGTSMEEKKDALISVGVSVATAAALWLNMGLANFTVVCMIPWCVMSFWLFMVTYLQHHSEDGKLYTDDTFTFERGAFETVDRNYGKWMNRLSHHMMDGHVIHHLFFEKVPHYRLEDATTALKKGLEEKGQSDIYKFIDTPDFTQEIVKQFNDNWFFINEKQVVRE